MLGGATWALAACGTGSAGPAPVADASPTAEPPPSSPASAVEGAELIGTMAPAWDVPFLGGTGPTLADLAGHPVLLRFWTDTCPFCRASAPALVALHERFAPRGATVIGMYHPKPRGTPRPESAVAEVAARFGFAFPIGLDQAWVTLDRYWLGHGSRRYTSSSFVIDGDGVIQLVHPGPEFHPGGADDHAQCRRDYAAVTAALERMT